MTGNLFADILTATTTTTDTSLIAPRLAYPFPASTGYATCTPAPGATANT